MNIMKDFVKALFYVTEGGKERISLTKTGAGIKQMGLWVGGSITGLQFLQGHETVGIGIGIAAAVLTGLGSWVQSAGERNTK